MVAKTWECDFSEIYISNKYLYILVFAMFYPTNPMQEKDIFRDGGWKCAVIDSCDIFYAPASGSILEYHNPFVSLFHDTAA